MPRRKQKSPRKSDESASTCKRRRTSQVINGPDIPWSREERERLIQGLHDDNCQYNWKAIKKCVGTRDVKQVKKYFEQLKEEQKSSAGFDGNLVTRNVSPIQVWIDLLEKLKNTNSGSRDVAGTVIPQVMRIAAMEPREDQGDGPGVSETGGHLARTTPPNHSVKAGNNSTAFQEEVRTFMSEMKEILKCFQEDLNRKDKTLQSILTILESSRIPIPPTNQFNTVPPGPAAVTPGSAAFTPGSAAFTPVPAAFTPGTAAFAPGTAAFAPGTAVYTPGPAAITPVTVAFTPGTAAFTPGTAAFIPGSAAVTPVTAAVTPGTAAFTPGPAAFTSGPAAVIPGAAAFTPGPAAVTPGPAAVAPVTAAFTPATAAFTPNPAAVAPSPAAVTPGPAAITPGPAAVTPGPAAIAHGPAAVTPGTTEVTPGPAAVTPDPAAFTPGSAAVTPSPVAVTPVPAAVTPSPVAVAPVPAAFTPDPAAVTPGPNMTKPEQLTPSVSVPVSYQQGSGSLSLVAVGGFKDVLMDAETYRLATNYSKPSKCALKILDSVVPASVLEKSTVNGTKDWSPINANVMAAIKEITGPIPDYHKIYTCLCNLLSGQPLPPLTQSDAEVLVTLLEGVEKKLLSCNVTEQVKFIRQSFKHHSNALVEKQVQNLAASLGSPSETSSHPTIEGDNGSNCSQSQTQESGGKSTDSPERDRESVSTQPEDSVTNDVAKPLSSDKNTTPKNLNGETANNSATVSNVKSKTSDVNERVLRPRKNKSEDCPETEQNHLATLNPVQIPVELLNFSSKMP